MHPQVAESGHVIDPARIVLVGMMGAGKSTVGRALSRLTGWPYIDNDELVQKLTGLPTRDLLQQQGVDAMRAAEKAAAEHVLAMEPPLIAGAAAGVVLDPELSARLHDGAFVVYLRARVETLEDRVEGTYRPWLGDDPGATLRTLYAGREPLYERIADVVIEVDEAQPDDVARSILEALEKSRRG
jgi:shikimate kinase